MEKQLQNWKIIKFQKQLAVKRKSERNASRDSKKRKLEYAARKRNAEKRKLENAARDAEKRKLEYASRARDAEKRKLENAARDSEKRKLEYNARERDKETRNQRAKQLYAKSKVLIF